MGSGKMRVKLDGFLELLDRLRQKPRFTICSAKDDPQLRSVAELFEHALVNLLRGSKLMLLEIGQSQRVCNVVIIRRDFESRLQFSGGLAEVTQHEIGLAQHVVRAGALRIVA